MTLEINADCARPIAIDTTSLPWLPSSQAGVERRLLPACPFGLEVVALERVPPGYDGPAFPAPRGEELPVLEGCLVIEGQEWPTGSWLRFPAGRRTRLQSGEGATYWAKRGHL